ncbi:ubiquitin-conjugating enzyme/RWD-like protein [Radiomyces spectabilis]|uniref:ubiquitin-conjugating enzyme/RWD-like protein n=1 Tax=Radiomyces spectabilis TaxID=64574 RepID=UPI00221EF99F|nr:ubiquitin-conjugating enzyme/RWD-like protein [Radiomyces spectabilis]KAI8379156.1 ubiquitin-conjugating enzyme/RWD-like protein [Radiomyces spectabilis]
MATKYNLKNPAVKRIMQEARELAMEECYEYEARPIESNIFEWHFTVRGPDGTEFSGGKYHGRILLPAEYPFKPPELIFLTPNGRFELKSKICLSITGFHPEYWQPAWGIRTVILAVMGFFPTEARGAIGGLDYSKEERRSLAKRSRSWICPDCQMSNDQLLTDTVQPSSSRPRDEDPDLPAFSFVLKRDQDDANGNESTHQTIRDTKDHDTDQSHNATSTNERHLKPSTSTAARHGATASHSATTSPQRPPIWLDGLIVMLLILLLGLIIERYIY